VDPIDDTLSEPVTKFKVCSRTMLDVVEALAVTSLNVTIIDPIIENVGDEKRKEPLPRANNAVAAVVRVLEVVAEGTKIDEGTTTILRGELVKEKVIVSKEPPNIESNNTPVTDKGAAAQLAPYLFCAIKTVGLLLLLVPCRKKETLHGLYTVIAPLPWIVVSEQAASKVPGPVNVIAAVM
jgi:hypothetical protein